MPKVSAACTAKMSETDKQLLTWKLNWIVGREYYRAKQDEFSKAFWDGNAIASYPNPDFTDGNSGLSAFRQQIKEGFDNNVPGWNNDTCTLDMAALACFCFWLASADAQQRIVIIELMVEYETDISELKAVCPPNVSGDPTYQAELPAITIPPLPSCKSGGSSCTATSECCTDLLCTQGKCVHATGEIGPDKLPPTNCPTGTSYDNATGQCVKPAAVNPVKADDTTTEKKTNWWLWGGLGVAVLGGAAMIGLLRDKEVVYDAPAAPNPRGKQPRPGSTIKVQFVTGNYGIYRIPRDGSKSRLWHHLGSTSLMKDGKRKWFLSDDKGFRPAPRDVASKFDAMPLWGPMPH